MKSTYQSFLWLFLLTLGIIIPIHAYAEDQQPVFISCLANKGKSCQWLKVSLPSGTQEVLATFPVDNFGARVSWSPDIQEAVVWFDPHSGLSSDDTSKIHPGYPSEKDRDSKNVLYRVNLKKKTIQKVPFPKLPVHHPDDIGITAKGELAAFDTADAPPGTHLEDIENAIARAFLWKDGKWTLFETKPTSAEECDAIGVAALTSNQKSGPGSTGLLDCHIDGTNLEGTKALGRLKKFEPTGTKPEDGEWTQVKTKFGTFEVWQASNGDYVNTTGLILLEKDGQPVPLTDEGFTAGDLVAIQNQGPYLLLASSQTGCHPRIYDLRTGELVFKSNSTRATLFWPKPTTGKKKYED